MSFTPSPSPSPSSSQPNRPRRLATLVPRSLHNPQSAQEFDELLTQVAKRSEVEEELRRLMQMQREQQQQKQQFKQQKQLEERKQQQQPSQSLPPPPSQPPELPPPPPVQRSAATAASTRRRPDFGRELRDLQYTYLLAGPGEDMFNSALLQSIQADHASAAASAAVPPSDRKMSDTSDVPSAAKRARISDTGASAAADSTTALVPAATAASPSSPFVQQAQSLIESQHQQHIAAQLEEDQRLARELQAEQLGRGPRTRRINAPELLADSFVMDEIEILTFKLTDLAGQHALDSRAVRPTPLPNNTRTIHPSQQNCQDVMTLFKSTFSNVSTETLTGYCSMILVDENDYRHKKSNVSNRAGSGGQNEPFTELACACVLDMPSHLVCNQLVMRITFFATAEKHAGRGYAKLLCCHLKTRAAAIAKRTGKEVTMLVMSLAHTLPFWTSKSMGFTVGGAVVQSLQAFNYTDTTGCSQPVLSASLDALCRERLQCIENVRIRRKQPVSELRVFPRFQQAVQKPKFKARRKTDGKAKAKAKTKGSIAAAPRNNRKGAVLSDEDESEESSDDSSSDDSADDQQRAPLVPPYVLIPSVTTPILLPGFSCAIDRPFAALQCEYERCLDLVALVLRRCCAIALPGRPTVQSAHGRLSDFSPGELCVVALPKRVCAIARVDDSTNFTMERCMVVTQVPNPKLGQPPLVCVHLVDRPCESQRPMHALTPLWYLYKPRQA